MCVPGKPMGRQMEHTDSKRFIHNFLPLDRRHHPGRVNHTLVKCSINCEKIQKIDKSQATYGLKINKKSRLLTAGKLEKMRK